MAEVMEKRRTTAGPGLRRKSRAVQPKKSIQSRVRLEQVLGLTASCSSLSSSLGLVAYPAGCVVVLLNPKTNKQSHILNSSRKPFSALSFSNDGKLLVTGESGHLPCVRVWDLEGSPKAEVQNHKYGVSCVAFSRLDQFIVSVGFQHDMTVCVWDWKKGAVIASNKVSSSVSSVSFSEDSSYFVTAGTRHLKFWYLDESAQSRVNSTVPLIGRSALLGEHKNSEMVAVACGRGSMSNRTFCITSSALLCAFNSQRTMDAWVHLKASSASSLSVCGDLVFCGCSNGIVRVFSSSLSYMCTLQRPHRLGVELQNSQSPGGAGVFPDTVALGIDSVENTLSCVYSDHSLYVWDLRDLKEQREQRRTYSALYHSGCIWSLEIYPELEDFESCLPPSSFLSSSSDNTIRMWSTESHSNRYSQDLLRIVYVGEALDSDRTEVEAEGKSGLRVLAVSPDGAHLATGDRHGNLSVFGLELVEELHKIEAHMSEVLCLTFSPESSGVRLLASASRDRLIHIFDRDQDYGLIQTLGDHSGSITAVRFTGETPDLKMVSCGADKSIYIQTAEQGAGLFTRTHHVVEKSSLYDLDLDSTRTQAAFACQDRNIRVYSVESGKLTKTLKGSCSDEGALLKVTFDPSGSFVATSCSDKTICIFDFESGECVATLHGHSEIVTSIRFSADCTRLISASGDSCIFVWRLDSGMTSLMRKRRGLDRKLGRSKQVTLRRETFITGPSNQIVLSEESSNQISLLAEEAESEVVTPGRGEMEREVPLLQTNGKMPLWFRKLQGEGGAPSALDQSEPEPSQVRRRWEEPIKIFSPCPTQDLDQEQDQEQEFHPQSLERLLVDEDEGAEPAGEGLFRDDSASDRDFAVHGGVDREVKGEEDQDSVSSDSESLSESRSSLVLENHQEQSPLQKHFDSLALNLSEERFDTDLRSLQPQDQSHFLQPRLSLSTRFLSRFQDRIRSRPQMSIPRILEESTIDNIQVQPETKESNVKPRTTESKTGTMEPKTRSIESKTGTTEPKTRSIESKTGTTEPKTRSIESKTRTTESKAGSAESKTGSAESDALSSRLLTQGIVGNAVSVKQDLDQSTGLDEKENLNPETRANPGLCGPAQGPGPGAEDPCGDMSFSAPPVATPPDCVSLPPAVVIPPPEPALNLDVSDITSSPAPECDRPRPPPSEQEVQQVALLLRDTAARAAQLYKQVQNVPSLAAVLRDAFDDLHSTVSSVCGDSAPYREAGNCSRDGAPCGGTGNCLEHCCHTGALLERYSELLLQMTRDKLRAGHTGNVQK